MGIPRRPDHMLGRAAVQNGAARSFASSLHLVPEGLLTLDEAAEVLRCSRRTVERRVADGELEIVRNGRRVLVTGGSLERFVAVNTFSVARGRPLRTPGRGRDQRRLWE